MRALHGALAGVAFLVVGLSEARAASPPSAEWIVQQVLKRDQVLQAHRRTFDYDLAERHDKLDEKGGVVTSRTQSSVVHGDRRPGYLPREGAMAAKSSSAEPPLALLAIIDHFTYSVEAIESVQHVPCFRIHFAPKPNQSYRNRQEKVMNQVSGHLWAATSDYSLLRNEGMLLHPVEVGWIFATLQEMEFHFESQPLPNGEFGPRQIIYRYRVQVPFGAIHERVTRTISAFRPAR